MDEPSMHFVWYPDRIPQDKIPQDKMPTDKIPKDEIPQDKIPQYEKWTKSHDMKGGEISTAIGSRKFSVAMCTQRLHMHNI